MLAFHVQILVKGHPCAIKQKTPVKYARTPHFTVYPVEYEEQIIPRGEPR